MQLQPDKAVLLEFDGDGEVVGESIVDLPLLQVEQTLNPKP
jgi:hypothetical protein